MHVNYHETHLFKSFIDRGCLTQPAILPRLFPRATKKAATIDNIINSIFLLLVEALLFSLGLKSYEKLLFLTVLREYSIDLLLPGPSIILL